MLLLAPAAAAAAQPSAAQLLARSERALRAAPAFSLRGVVYEQHGAVALSLSSSGNGADVAGTLTSAARRALGFVGTISFVRLGSSLYLKGTAPFWTSASGAQLSPPLLRVLSQKWVFLSGGDGRALAASLGAITDPRRLAGEVFGTSTHTPSLGPPTTVANQRVLTIRFPHGRLYVTAQGTHLPVEATGSGPISGRLSFSYPPTLRIDAPKGATSLVGLIRSLP